MSMCVWAAGKSVLCVSACAFSLAWTHSVEKTEWIEHWVLVGHEMHQTQARVKGFGAGMEPASNATLDNGWWVWKPDNPLHLTELHLAASGATEDGWRVCTEGQWPTNAPNCINLFEFEGANQPDLVLIPNRASTTQCRPELALQKE